MYDILIKNGKIVDGTASKPYFANIAVKDGKIAKITTDGNPEAKTVIDAEKKIVSPGFIDIHSHSDVIPFQDYIADSKIFQGITTEVVGNCGSSCHPVPEKSIDQNDHLFRNAAEYKKAVLSAGGYISNIVPLSGHNPLRKGVLDFDMREPNEEEMQKIENELSQDLESGSFGLSLGLIYAPSSFSSFNELVRMAKVIKKYDGILAVHMRNEGPKVFEAVDEMLSVARESGVRLQISHFKLTGTNQWHKSKELIEKIEKAKEEGINVNCDQYPFNASSTSLTALLPTWAHEGGNPKIIERLSSPTDELKNAIAKNIENRCGGESILLASVDNAPQYNGKYISEIAKEFQLSETDAVIKVLLDASSKGTIVARAIYFMMNFDDIYNIMKQSYIAVGTDGRGFSFDKNITKTNQHPRNYGTFPQFFQTVREKDLMPIENAVYKCTALPASILGIQDRGILKEGNFADITVFDYDLIRNNSEYTEPHRVPDGIDYVIVNGKIAAEHNKIKEAHAGMFLLKR